MTELFTAAGERLQLDRLVGRGGEGEVYAITGSADRLVKRYTLKDLASREVKIARMVASELYKSSNLIAFPIAQVRDRQGRFAGFTMARVNDHQPLHELYSPGARKAAFPAARYAFLVHAAANIARVVASAHNAGCVIGDINHSGVLISKQATAALIDADSFQISDGSVIYFCKVGVPEYTPPELQGVHLDGVMRTKTHDEFGLAVAIFLLLWMGRHPFSGRFASGDMPMEKAIREFRFVYSTQRSVGMTPPPGVPTLKDFPPQIGAAFEQAFGPQGVNGRPTALQWVTLLDELESSLRECAANKLHHYPAAATECPWCRMEKTLHAQLFLPLFAVGATHAPVNVDLVGRDLEGIWRAIEALPAPPSAPGAPALPTLPWTQSPGIAAAQQKAQVWKVVGGAIIAAAALGLIAAPSLILLWGLLGWFGATQLWRPIASPNEDLLRRYRDIESQWQRALGDWRQRCSGAPFGDLKQNLKQTKTEIERLPSLEKQRTQAYYANRRAEQLNQFLDAFQIRRVKITGIGPSKLAMLTSYGIETAADVNQAAVLRVPGFGPVNSQPLLAWRQQLETRFIYNASPNAGDTTAINAIKADLAKQSATLHEQLADGARKLAQIAADIRNKQQQPDPTLLRLHTQREQVLGDLKSLNITPPPVYVPPPPPPPRPTTYYARPQSVPGTNCPRCGSRMILRTAYRGANAGSRFWGCPRFPRCKGTRPYP